MPKILPTITNEEFDQQIANIIKLDREKWNLGDGLFFIKKGPRMDFQMRSSIQGKDTMRTLGHYPELLFSKARKLADGHRKQIQAARQAQRDEVFEDKIIKSKQQNKYNKFCEYDNFNYANHFILLLKSLIFDPKKTDVQREVYCAVVLAMFLPTRINELLTASFSDFLSDLTRWDIVKKNENETHCSQLLHPNVTFILCKLVKLNDVNRRLFSALANYTLTKRNQIIHAELDVIRPNDNIRLNQFKPFFVGMAMKHSDFKPSFIRNVASHYTAKSYRDNELSLEALHYWWGEKLSVQVRTRYTHAVAPKAVAANNLQNWRNSNTY